jgi:hypothetical protein
MTCRRKSETSKEVTSSPFTPHKAEFRLAGIHPVAPLSLSHHVYHTRNWSDWELKLEPQNLSSLRISSHWCSSNICFDQCTALTFPTSMSSFSSLVTASWLGLQTTRLSNKKLAEYWDLSLTDQVSHVEKNQPDVEYMVIFSSNTNPWSDLPTTDLWNERIHWRRTRSYFLSQWMGRCK